MHLLSLAPCKQLQRLRFRNCADLLALPDLSHCLHLEDLCCWHCYNLEALPDLTAFPELKTLTVDSSGPFYRASGFQEELHDLRDRGVCITHHAGYSLYV